MAVPKRRMSRSNTRHRRAQWLGDLARSNQSHLVSINLNGREVTVPRRLVKAYQRGLIEPGA